MAEPIACIAGEEVYRQWEAGRISGKKLGSQETPFGKSGEIFLVRSDGEDFYLLSRYGLGMDKTAPGTVNYLANMYAIKELGVQYVLAWGPGGAITHNIAVGDLVVLEDVIDRTHLRSKTFFENSPLGFLRQFPVFCPTLRRVAGQVLHDMKLLYHGSTTAAVCEGPRFETPAEVRALAAAGAEIVTHAFVPEVFLAKELELCYSAVCYIVNFAETGSQHRPFAGADLFGGLTQVSDSERLAGSVGAMSQIVAKLAAAIDENKKVCDCDKTQQANVCDYKLSEDWQDWFER